jgi:hypothetical protein
MDLLTPLTFNKVIRNIKLWLKTMENKSHARKSV